jgi:hypothetical protein
MLKVRYRESSGQEVIENVLESELVKTLEAVRMGATLLSVARMGPREPLATFEALPVGMYDEARI